MRLVDTLPRSYLPECPQSQSGSIVHPLMQSSLLMMQPLNCRHSDLQACNEVSHTSHSLPSVRALPPPVPLSAAQKSDRTALTESIMRSVFLSKKSISLHNSSCFSLIAPFDGASPSYDILTSLIPYDIIFTRMFISRFYAFCTLLFAYTIHPHCSSKRA